MSMDEKSLKYTAEHEWVALDESTKTATIGITPFAAEQLGDVIYVDLPAVGDSVSAGEVFGEIESTKSVAELFAPLSGEVAEANADVDADPASVSADPFASWLIKVTYDEVPELLDHDAYQRHIGA